MTDETGGTPRIRTRIPENYVRQLLLYHSISAPLSVTLTFPIFLCFPFPVATLGMMRLRNSLTLRAELSSRENQDKTKMKGKKIVEILAPSHQAMWSPTVPKPREMLSLPIGGKSSRRPVFRKSHASLRMSSIRGLRWRCSTTWKLVRGGLRRRFVPWAA